MDFQKIYIYQNMTIGCVSHIRFKLNLKLAIINENGLLVLVKIVNNDGFFQLLNLIVYKPD